MIVGHALLAFALAATLTRRFHRAERALTFGVIAAAFAAIPDVDVAYGLLGVFDAVSGSGAVIESFWTAGLIAHRGLTHSLVVGVVVAVALGLVATQRPTRWAIGGVALVGVVTVGGLGGPLAAFSAGLFVLLGVLVTVVSVRRLGVDPVEITALSGLGLLTHPAGDLFTGEPPAVLFPVTGYAPDRIALAPDPTLHLLGTFALELLVAWFVLLVLAALRGSSIRDSIAPRALAGASFGAAALVLAPPTLEAPYLFTASVLPVAASVGVSCWVRPPIRIERPSPLVVVATGLAALTVALLAYTGVYVAV